MSEKTEMSEGMKIGVLGGSFDPVHMGHLSIAEEAREAFRLDRVVFVPAAKPPHKGGATAAPAADRLRMVELAVAGNPAFIVSDVEMRRDGPSYTIDTLDEIQRMYPEMSVYFIVGADSLAELHNWHRAGDLVRRFDFLIIGRPGAPGVSLDGLKEKFGPEAARRLDANYLRSGFFELSATEIRERARAGRSIRYLVPRAVERYILARGLYR